MITFNYHALLHLSLSTDQSELGLPSLLIDAHLASVLLSQKTFHLHLTLIYSLTNFFSPSLFKIADAPVCREPQRSTYGLALGETAKILCQIDSDPVPSSFLWYFNNSNEKIPLRNFTVNQTSSILTYQPRSR